MHHLRGDRLEGVLDFGRQQVAVLESDLGRLALQVHLDPAVALARARGLLQARIGLRLARNQREPQGQQQNCGKKRPYVASRYYSEGSMDDTTQLRKLTAHVKAAG